jgi:hypothetical protein
MNRNLDGIYFRVKRNGRYTSVCFSDLTEEEQNHVLDEQPEKFLKKMCKILAFKLKEIGDMFDIAAE